jgi:hypothetical protein
VNWWLIVGAFVLAWIGGSLTAQGDNGLTRWMGVFVVMGAGMLAAFGLNIPEAQGYIQPDEKACAQYVFVEGTWKCVPWTEAG